MLYFFPVVQTGKKIAYHTPEMKTNLARPRFSNPSNDLGYCCAKRTNIDIRYTQTHILKTLPSF